MRRELYVIRDLVACESGPIFEAKNHGVALRQYAQIINQNKGNPRDFCLLHVGQFNHETDEGYFIRAAMIEVDMDTMIEEGV